MLHYHLVLCFNRNHAVLIASTMPFLLNLLLKQLNPALSLSWSIMPSTVLKQCIALSLTCKESDCCETNESPQWEPIATKLPKRELFSMQVRLVAKGIIVHWVWSYCQFRSVRFGWAHNQNDPPYSYMDIPYPLWRYRSSHTTPH